MDLISKPFCAVTFLTAGHSNLISAVKIIFIRHKVQQNILNTNRLTLAKEETALSKNSWEVLRGGGSIV